MAREVAQAAIAKGEFGGERVCSDLYLAMLEKGMQSSGASWPEACGGTPR